ncbi:hypothetical protein GDO86_012413 [Hymenochirus boettgeri]|uniref:SAP domain-containing protein n=1 Tax=Hymenochirus boettgeri TaxID=247094 RepID=A0A8T2IST9_9PIPI|nr:hypothetical protein GDO86_012413 [Hymenochirus boettgeri]
MDCLFEIFVGLLKSTTAPVVNKTPFPEQNVNLGQIKLDLPQIIEVDQPSTEKVTEADPLATNRPANHQPTQASSTISKISVKPTDVGKIQRQKKPKDAKPKVKKLKYHQYIPPDQKAERAPVAMDAAYSRLLQQQQIFLQLQILNQQQNPTFCVQTVHPLTTSISADQVISFTGAPPAGAPTINLSPSPGTAAITTASTPTVPSPLKPEILPSNLDDLRVSELRRHLRKRGLPVSGTKPALLERLRPYQIPHAKTIPAPIQSAGLITPILELPTFQGPSTCDSTAASLCTFQTAQSPATGEIPHEPSEMSCAIPESAEIPASVQDKDSPMQDVDEDHVLIEKQKVIENLTWKLKQEQKQAEDLRVELEMHKRLKNRRKSEKLTSRLHIKTEIDASPTSCCAKVQAEEPQMLYNIKKEPPQEPLIKRNINESYMAFCPPSCDMIGQDFELPMQITASPESPVQKPRTFEEELQEAIQKAQVQGTLGSTRTFEEELQEAIQKAQMALSQSIDDILEDNEHLICTDDLMHIDQIDNIIEHHSVPVPSTQQGNFVKPIYCSNEAPPTPSTIGSSGILEFPAPGSYDLLSAQDNLSVIFAPDQIEIPSVEHQESDSSSSPTSSSSSSAPFDPADWLEALTSGSASSFGPTSPVGSSIFSTDIFDSPDLSINRMIDLMVEQW